MIAKFSLRCLAFLSLTASLAALAEEAPAHVGKRDSSPEDRRAIEKLLSTYTNAVSTGNEAAFEALLLDENVPFSSTNALIGSDTEAGHMDTRRYQEFRKAVFGSGTHYTQQFHNVHIEQDGVLAQVSLDFVTRVVGSNKGGYGFKTLHLLKLQGQWKIASEFYTAHSLPERP